MSIGRELKVSNCPKCGNVFQKNLRNLCQRCVVESEQRYGNIKEYLRRNRKATTDEVSDITGIDRKEIVTFIKEGKLILSDYPALTYPCESCGCGIRQHKLCTDCSTRLSRDIRSMFEKENKQEQSKGIGFRIGNRL